MNIHEYQAKEILRVCGVPTPAGFLVQEDTETSEIAKSLARLGGKVFAVKAQIHAGGRGKAGGVVICRSVEEAIDNTKKMLGMNLVTHQTSPAGQKVRKVYIEAGQSILKEYYLSMVVDRENAKVAIIASEEGGMDIEEIARSTPEKIKKVFVDLSIGISDFHARKIGFELGLSLAQIKQFTPLVKKLYALFVTRDASQVEINPLIANSKGEFIALDAKLNFDDNALYRHPDTLELRDLYEEDPKEIEAAKYNLNYIKMEGGIGCMVNGAGLAMATMDIIKYYGASPANFLDVGGGANLEQVTNAFKIISSDKHVAGILVNIFGGIMRCDIIAEGIVAAAKDIGLTMPLVVRLSGTNYSAGIKIIEGSGLNIVTASELDDAAQKIVKLTRKEI
ncbi:ADP-forming succinate--CoA ligase subunit beta [Neorickettsia sennetsu]|uniref:Succinate--CoA ligase [ADP-forming] subunit beta n=1 Tax=Ehrlichia sennetsu (strain ATCC VR-367 / Miyayama) TaxID=222891 RepID=SUCC_EHRS3|nr:ADP-forming succinate--CoA ligase subunit beta [Neorickettsia sennetsu]Q2GEF1.1 RecName: Full=Succinate--CoA ligase [ADP-forming] subunit beta; AltName: Full=Succinyl-CoA synthetase subunit beta; Short=SCS-beta [Neorickettsia sennetsu str. Miyayama]ABD46226.1 succinyl-CoA synthetase, beta subunit [Neorickettsia sennetsu str. Miyayama]